MGVAPQEDPEAVRCRSCRTSTAPREFRLPSAPAGVRPRYYVCADCDHAYFMPTPDRVLNDVVAFYVDQHNSTA